MRTMLPLGCLVLALAGAAHGQTPRLRFLDLPPANRPIMGRITLHVNDDPFNVPARSRVVIRLDGTILADCWRLPCDLAWETDGIPDGRHLLQLVLLEEHGDKTVDRILDERTIEIRNGKAPRRQEPAEPKGQPVKERAESKPAVNEAPVPRAEKPTASAESSHKQEPREGSRPQVGHLVQTPAELESKKDERKQTPSPTASSTAVSETSADLKGLNATTVALSGHKLVIGLADGGVTIYDTAERKGATVAGPAGCGETRAVCTGGGVVWWLTAPAIVRPVSNKQNGAPAPASIMGPMLCAFRPTDGSLDTYDVSAVGTRFEPKQILPWRGKLALVSGSQGAILDPKTGEFSDIESEIPREVVRARQRGATVRFAGDGSACVVSVVENAEAAAEGSPARIVRIWRSRGGDWFGGDRETVMAPGQDCAASLTSSALTLLATEGVTVVPVSRGESRTVTLPPGLPSGDSRAGAVDGGEHAWWLRGSLLFHADRERNTADALFPWNVRGMKPRALAADKDGVWVATNAGVRRVDMDAPDTESGYGGFVRARLGADTTEAGGPVEQKLAEAIESWQGTPYVWGGESRKGVDCSGFVMLAFREAGYDLPHGSDNLRGFEGGQLVRDELRYGDVLIYPGHAAIYIGNGQTAETVSTGKRGVGKSTIWRRSEAVVRRFLGVAVEGRTFASRGGKPPLRKPSATKTKRRAG